MTARQTGKAPEVLLAELEEADKHTAGPDISEDLAASIAADVAKRAFDTGIAEDQLTQQAIIDAFTASILAECRAKIPT